MAFRIAEGFVEVTSRFNEGAIRRSAYRVGRRAGQAFGEGFNSESETWMGRADRGMGGAFRRSGDHAGREFGEGFFRSADGRLRDSRGRFAAGFSRSGRDSGRGFSLGFVSEFGSQAGGMMSTVGGSFSKIGLKSGHLLIAAIVAALSALPAIGATLATTMTFAFGAGIAGIGIFAAAQSEKVKKSFSGLADHVKSTMKRIARPFEGTLVAISGQARSLFDSLAPHLAKSFQLAAPAVELFAGKFLGALKGLGPVIDVATQAFVRMLGPLSDAAGPAFRGLLDALKNMFATVRDTPELQAFFGGFVAGIINTVTGLIRLVTWLAKTYVWFGNLKQEVLASPVAAKAREIGAALKSGFGDFVSNTAPKVIGKAKQLGSAIGSAFDRAKDSGGPKLKAAFDSVAPGFDGITGKLKVLGSAIADRATDIGNKIGTLFGKIVDKIKEFREKHAAEIDQIVGKIAEVGRKVGQTLGSAIDLITAIVNRVGSVLGFVFDVISAVWDRVGSHILSALMSIFKTVVGLLSGYITVIKGIFDLFTGILTGDWSKAWNGIKTIFSGVWTAIVAIFQGAVGLIVSIVKTAVSLIVWPFQWLYDKIVGNSIIPDLVHGVVGWFRNLLSWAIAPLKALGSGAVAVFTTARDWVLQRVSALRDGVGSRLTTMRDRATALVTNARDWITSRITNARDWVLSRLTSMRDGAISRVLGLRDRATALITNARDWVVSRATSLRDRVMSVFTQLKDRSITAFSKLVDGVKTVFNRLRSAAAGPVNFVIDPVYRRGIKGVWDRIGPKIGLGTLPDLKRFAKGGITDVRGGAALSGYSRTDDQLVMARSGEGVIVPEAVKSLGAGFVHAANRLKGRASELLGIPGFDIGGIVGGFAGRAKDFFVGGFVKALKAAMGPIVRTVTSRFGSGPTFSGMPGRAVEHIAGKAVSFLSRFASQLEGGNGKKVVDIAERYVGLSGNPNKFTRRMGMNGLPWCGMFVDGVFDEAKAGKALRGVSNPAAVWSYRSLPSVSQGAKRAGDLGLYRGDSGHINIYTGRGAITIGGNESNSVRRQSGYIGSASSIRRPRFERGGIVDFIWQDDRESDWLNTAARTRGLRDVMALPPWGTHDVGGVLPHGGVAVNQSGSAEVVQTLDQLRAIVEAAKGQQITYIFEEGSIVLDATKMRDIRDLLDMIASLQATARQHGAKVKVR